MNNNGSKDRIDEEFGDLMFALINYSRFLKINADDALEHANAKFKRRFSFMEEKANESGKSIVDMGLDELESLWVEAKKIEIKSK